LLLAILPLIGAIARIIQPDLALIITPFYMPILFLSGIVVVIE